METALCKRNGRIAVLFALGCALSQGNSSLGYSDEAFTSYIVQYDEEAPFQTDLATIDHVRLVSTFDGFAAIEVENEHLNSVKDLLADDDSIANFEEDSIWTEQGLFEEEIIPGKPGNLRRLQTEYINYGIKMVQGDQVEVGLNPVKVCIVDTGVANAHPDLDYSYIEGEDRSSNFDGSFLAWNKDVRGHGTHTTGILNAVANNGEGIERGMGRIPIFVTRGLNDKGKAKESDILSSLDQCEEGEAKIISLSLAGPYMTTAMTSKIESLHAKGFMIFAASGNQGENVETFPASHKSVISVGAVTEQETRWVDSNFGPWIELVGPGNKIPSTSVNILGVPIYSKYSGTSMSCPHVAGAAALVWSHFPECTNTQVRYALAYTAKGDGKCSDEFGYGIVQSKAALNFLASHPCNGSTWGQIPSPDGKCSTIDEQPTNSWSSSWKPAKLVWSNWGF